MRYVELSRRELIEWAGSGGHAARVRQLAPADALELSDSRAELIGIWSEEELPVPLPAVLVTKEGGERDLLAWAATYLPLKPLTAFCRVIERSDLRLVADRVSMETARLLALGCVGMIFAEMILRNSADGVHWLPSLTSAQETFSFAASRALAVGSLRENATRLHDRWLSLQRLAGAGRRPDGILREMWARVGAAAAAEQLALFGDGTIDPVVRALRELIASGTVTRNTWLQVTGAEFVSFERLTLEERVRTFRTWAAALAETVGAPGQRAFALAYMANEIRPGSFEHISVLRDVNGDFEPSVLWYGLLAGIHGSSRMGALVNGLGWRILKEAFASESPAERTRADISIGEFSVLLENPASRATIRPMHAPRVRVELLPCVYSEVEWPERFSAPEGQRAAIRDPFGELGLALARANDAYRELSSAERTGSPRPRADRKKK